MRTTRELLKDLQDISKLGGRIILDASEASFLAKILADEIQAIQQFYREVNEQG